MKRIQSDVIVIVEDDNHCPLCGKRHHEVYKPYCSERCRVTDLFRFLGGTFVERSIRGRSLNPPKV